MKACVRAHWWRVLFLAAFLVVVTRPNLDTDLGWHLRYGEYFFKTGHVLRDNILSFVWPQYQWVQASWGYDVITYFVFTHGGFWALSLAVGIITLITFFIITYPVENLSFFQLLFLAAIFSSQAAPMYFSGMRSQTPSSLLFAVTLLIADRALTLTHVSKWWLIALPIVFLLWANLHGGFVLGLGVCLVFWLVHGAMLLAHRIKPSIDAISAATWRRFGMALFVSALVPLISPWGVRIYEETYKHATNVNLAGITEWVSLADFVIESKVMLVLALFTFLVRLKYHRSADAAFIAAYLFVTYLAFNALRFLIPFAIMTVYSLAHTLPPIGVRFKSSLVGWGLRLGIVTLILIDVFATKRYFVPYEGNIFRFSWADYCAIPKGHCSEEISAIMRANPPSGNGFHPYEYGGYLSWRVPQVKTFVDGRMAAWEDHGTTPPVIDGDRIIMEPEPVTFRRFDSQYQFQWAIIPTPTPIAKYLDILVKNGLWERRYRDRFYSYFVKVKK